MTKLRVFVASPSDVTNERERLAREIERLNRTLGVDAKVVLELIRWETHTWPGFGEDAQAVINQQIAPYDIFVGIMWRRLGTRTGRSSSGTVEEFDRAYALWKTHRRPHIMFYFNRAPAEPESEEDRSQADGVQAFKRVVSGRGGLWHEYEGAQQFSELIHEHLYSEVRQLLQESRSPSARPEPATIGGGVPGTAPPAVPAPAMARERKLVTVLYADIVGSTALTAQQDAEVVRETLDRAFATIERILIGHGATVEKFIGDAVMAVFGIPSSHDDDADRAVRAAFATREAIASFPTPGGGPLALRIGINTGDAVAGGPAAERVLVTGEPVVVGARLQQAAAPGEILVGPLTRRLTTGGVRYGPSRRVDAKGLAGLEASPALEVTTVVPEEHRGLTGLRAPLIGREKEMRFLHEAYENLASEERAYVVTVFGPPGSGKTRLADEFVASLQGVRVRRGRCLPYGDGITYYALMTIIRTDARIVPEDSRDVALEKLRSAIGEAFGESPDADPVLQRVSVIAGLARPDEVMPIAAGNISEELRWGVRRYLERRAGDAPMVVVFEDIHWAEQALLDAIEHLAEASRARLFVLCLARPDLRELRPTWGGGATNAAALDLSPLSAENTRTLIAELLSLEALPETLRSDVVSRAEGNPLYVEEFLRMLIDEGRLQKRDGKWVADDKITTFAIPATLQGLITSRLDRVSSEVKQLLQRASVPGRSVSTAALAALGDGLVPAPELLREATRRDLLSEVDVHSVGGGRAFRFKHALIRDVAYSTLPKSERARLHDVYGRWLEQMLGERSAEITDVIAYHAEQAYLIAKELRHDGAAALGQRAFAVLREAALNADRRDDSHAARSLFGRAAGVGAAIYVPPRDAIEVEGFVALHQRRLDSTVGNAGVVKAVEATRPFGPSLILARLLSEASWGGGFGHEESQRFAREAELVARTLGDPELLAEAEFMVGFSAPTFEDAYRIFKESHLAQLASGARRTLPRTLGQLGLVAANLGRFAEGFEYREEALRLARASGSKLLLVEALMRLIAGVEHVGDLARGLALGEEMLAVANDLGLPFYEMSARFFIGQIMADLGDETAAREHFEHVFEIATARGISLLRDVAACRLVRSYLREGEPDVAEKYFPAKFETLGLDVPSMDPIRLEARAEIRAARGEDERADSLFREALRLFDSLGEGYNRAEARRTYARFLIARGRAREAREHVEWLLHYYAEPIAERQRRVAEELMRQCEDDTLR